MTPVQCSSIVLLLLAGMGDSTGLSSVFLRSRFHCEPNAPAYRMRHVSNYLAMISIAPSHPSTNRFTAQNTLYRRQRYPVPLQNSRKYRQIGGDLPGTMPVCKWSSELCRRRRRIRFPTSSRLQQSRERWSCVCRLLRNIFLYPCKFPNSKKGIHVRHL
jgi:hypothetical protein